MHLAHDINTWPAGKGEGAELLSQSMISSRNSFQDIPTCAVPDAASRFPTDAQGWRESRKSLTNTQSCI
ncbi:hypothetical protein FRC11_004660 [Ceratobasidium sp. 423]|nr:hypothetical protein FRC11_004660 [Ceratobasidium sp. 423]